METTQKPSRKRERDNNSEDEEMVDSSIAERKIVTVKRKQKKEDLLEFEDSSDDNIAEDEIGSHVQKEESDDGEGWESDGGEIEMLNPDEMNKAKSKMVKQKK